MEDRRKKALINFLGQSNMIEGINHVTGAEVDAAILFLDEPSRENLVAYVLETAGATLRVKHGMNVRVGNHIAPRGGPEILDKLEELLELARDEISSEFAYRCHVNYENLHPFMDGNGRSGRLVWYMQMNEDAPLNFLHHWYYQTLSYGGDR